MLRHLRLARARGSLTAPNSPIQDSALDICLIWEDGRYDEERFDLVKQALASRLVDWERAEQLWPDRFPERDPYEQALDEEGNFDPDLVPDDQLEWGVPDPDEDAKISAWIDQASGGEFTLADFEI